MSRLKKFALDAISNYLNMFLKIILYFVSIPIYLNVYGEELYGVFLLTFGLASSFIFFDFGITNSLIRYASAFKRNENLELFSKELSFSLSSMVYSGFIVSTLFVILAVFAPYIFKIPEEHKETAFRLFLIAIPFTLSIFVFNFTKFFLNGLGHFFKRNLLQTFNIAITFLILLLVYFVHLNILYFALLSMLPNIIGIIIDIAYLKKHESKLFQKLNIRINLNWTYIFKSEYSKFNLNIFKNSIIGFFSREIDKPLIAYFLGSGALVGFSIMMRPFTITKSLIANVFFVIQQKLQKNLNNKERLKKMILAFSRSNYILTFFFIIVVTIVYPGFVSLWLPKENFNMESNWAFWAIVNLLLMGFYKAQYSLLSLSDDNIKTVKLSLVSVLINVIISIVFINKIGVLSVVLGTTLQALYNLFYFYFFSKKIYSISILEYFNLKYLIVSLVIFFLALYLKHNSFFDVINWWQLASKATVFILPLSIIIFFIVKKELKIIKSL